MKSVYRTVCLFIALTLGGVAYGQESTPVAQAEALVDGFHAELLDVMKGAGETTAAQRSETLSPVIASTFDTAFMAQVASGRHWSDFSEQEQVALIDTFAAFTTANYANRFDGFNGERFEIKGTRESRGRIVVQSEIIKSNGDAVPLTYLVHQTPTGLKIADVFLDGSISELATRRSEFGSVLKTGGHSSLIASLKDKTDDLLNG